MDEEMRSELLALCPFCGGTANLHENNDYWYVACRECINQTAHFYNGKDIVLKSWNARRPIDERLRRIEKMLDEAIYIEFEEWAIYNNYPFAGQNGDGKIRLFKKHETNHSWDGGVFPDVLSAFEAMEGL